MESQMAAKRQISGNVTPAPAVGVRCLPHESGAPQKTRLRLLSHQTPPNSPSQLEADYIRRRELSAERLRKFGRGLLATRTRNASISTYCDPLQPIESSDDR